MTTESLEELRDRLLREDRVQLMVRARAYEIYRMRGGQPGWESRDWFQAEGEVLAFLIANESGSEDEEIPAATTDDVYAPEPIATTNEVSAPEPAATSEAPPTKAPSSRKATGNKKAAIKKTVSKKTASKTAKSKSKTSRTQKSSKKEKSDQ